MGVNSLPAPGGRRCRVLALAAIGALLAAAGASPQRASASAAPAAPALAAADLRAALERHSFATLDGGAARLGPLGGQVVVVSFWASWCAPCRKELAYLARLHADLAGRGARVVAISIDRDRSRAKHFAQAQHLQLPLYHDGAQGLAAQLDLPHLPCTYVLDRGGKVVSVSGGGGDEVLASLRRIVEGLLSAPAAAMAGATGGAQ